MHGEPATLTPAREKTSDLRLQRRMNLAVGGGVLLAMVTLWSLSSAWSELLERATNPFAEERGIQLIAHQKGWSVEYAPGRDRAARIRSAELRLPVDTVQEVGLSSRDVVHSLYIPGLLERQTIVPGLPKRVTLRTTRPGLYRGECADFCGVAHAVMVLPVVVEPLERFETWLGSPRSVPAPREQLERRVELP